MSSTVQQARKPEQKTIMSRPIGVVSVLLVLAATLATTRPATAARVTAGTDPIVGTWYTTTATVSSGTVVTRKGPGDVAIAPAGNGTFRGSFVYADPDCPTTVPAGTVYMRGITPQSQGTYTVQQLYWTTEPDGTCDQFDWGLGTVTFVGPTTLRMCTTDPLSGVQACVELVRVEPTPPPQPQLTPQSSPNCSCKSCSKQDAQGAGAKGSAARPALAVPGVSTLSGTRAMHLGDTRMAQGHYGCQWYGTVHVLKTWHSAKRLLVLPPSTPRGKLRTVYSVEGQCEESLVFSPPDRVTAALNYFEWHNIWEPYVKDIGTLIQNGMTSLIPNWTSPKLNGKLPFGPYTTRPMDGKLIQTGDDVTARDIQIGVHDATVAWDINGAMVQEKSGNRTIKLNEHTAECYPINFGIDPTHPKDKIGPIPGSYRDTDGTVYPADSYIDWDLYQQK